MPRCFPCASAGGGSRVNLARSARNVLERMRATLELADRIGRIHFARHAARRNNAGEHQRSSSRTAGGPTSTAAAVRQKDGGGERAFVNDRSFEALLLRSNCSQSYYEMGTHQVLGNCRSDTELKMLQTVGLSIALLLFGSGVWANVASSSLSQNTGAWVSKVNR
jgi:hypothetical protein